MDKRLKFMLIAIFLLLSIGIVYVNIIIKKYERDSTSDFSLNAKSNYTEPANMNKNEETAIPSEQENIERDPKLQDGPLLN